MMARQGRGLSAPSACNSYARAWERFTSKGGWCWWENNPLRARDRTGLDRITGPSFARSLAESFRFTAGSLRLLARLQLRFAPGCAFAPHPLVFHHLSLPLDGLGTAGLFLRQSLAAFFLGQAVHRQPLPTQPDQKPEAELGRCAPERCAQSPHSPIPLLATARSVPTRAGRHGR